MNLQSSQCICSGRWIWPPLPLRLISAHPASCGANHNSLPNMGWVWHLTDRGAFPVQIWKVTSHVLLIWLVVSATVITPSNKALMINYESTFFPCITFFLPHILSETHLSVLFSCNFWTFLPRLLFSSCLDYIRTCMCCSALPHISLLWLAVVHSMLFWLFQLCPEAFWEHSGQHLMIRQL